MTSTFKTTLFNTVLCTVLLGLGACSNDDDPPVENTKKGIQLRNDSNFGTVLTDADGKTLYFFSNDAKGSSACTGNCLAMWPVYHSADASTDPDLDQNEVEEITRADGARQTTYKGWPLYYFANDSNPNDIGGDGRGKIWYVAKPDYMLMVVNAQLVGADGKSYKEDYTEGEASTIYFTDDHGRTLYAFAPDKFNKNTFTNPDFSNDAVWPIYQVISGALPSVIEKGLVSSIDVHGKKQLTYKGWPLYYFGQDTGRGDNKGISFPRPGVWPIVNENTATAPEE